MQLSAHIVHKKNPISGDLYSYICDQFEQPLVIKEKQQLVTVFLHVSRPKNAPALQCYKMI